jgi:hypothetical protein
MNRFTQQSFEQWLDHVCTPLDDNGAKAAEILALVLSKL